MTSSPTSSASQAFILITIFLDVLGIGLIIPVLPSLIGTLTSSQAEQAHWYGWLASAFGVMQFLCMPFLGALSDRYGRRPVLLLSTFGLGISYLVTALSYSLWLLLLARLVSGATSATMSVANAYVADITAPEQRAKAFGKVGAAFGIGFVFGPVLGGTLGAVDVRLPFMVAAVLALINVLYGYFVLPESLEPHKRNTLHWKQVNPFGALVHLSRLKDASPLIIVFSCSALGQFILHTTWVLYTEFRFNWTPQQNGVALFVVGATSALVQGVFMGRLLQQFGELRLAILGMLSSFIITTSYGLTTQGLYLYPLIMLNFLSFAANPALNSLISKTAGQHEQGLVQGALNGINSLMMIIAPLIGSWLLAKVSHLPNHDWRMGSSFFMSAGLQLLAVSLAIWHFRKQDKQSPS
jgi:DHA1 family tetracycline resistance protein-like MFS transporter